MNLIQKDNLRTLLVVIGAVALVAGVTVGAGVHSAPNPIAVVGGYAYALGYMALLLVGGRILERTIHPGQNWITIIEKKPLALAVFWGSFLVSSAIVILAVFLVP